MFPSVPLITHLGHPLLGSSLDGICTLQGKGVWIGNARHTEKRYKGWKHMQSLLYLLECSCFFYSI